MQQGLLLFKGLKYVESAGCQDYLETLMLLRLLNPVSLATSAARPAIPYAPRAKLSPGLGEAQPGSLRAGADCLPCWGCSRLTTHLHCPSPGANWLTEKPGSKPAGPKTRPLVGNQDYYRYSH